MALVQVGFRTVVTLQDGGGQSTRRSYENVASLYADALSDAAELIAALNAITDAQITGYSVETVFGDDALSGFPAVTVQNENQALLIYQLDGLPLHRATQSIPAPVIGIFSGATGPNSNTVDTADTDLLTWRALFLVSNDKYYLSDGEQALLLEKGHRRHTKKAFG